MREMGGGIVLALEGNEMIKRTCLSRHGWGIHAAWDVSGCELQEECAHGAALQDSSPCFIYLSIYFFGGEGLENLAILGLGLQDF